MKEVFADTFYFLALANPEDRAHARAKAAFEDSSGLLVTTAWVLTEVGNTLCRLSHRRKFLSLLALLRGNSAAITAPATHDLFERGLALYAERPDKEWSVTDCISFVVMKQRGIRDALTGDRHFEQAGFRALLK